MVGDNATIAVLRQNETTETYTIPWDKFGTPLISGGLEPSQRTTQQKTTAVNKRHVIPELVHRGIVGTKDDDDPPANPWGA